MSSLCFQTQRSPCFVCGQAALAERTQSAAFRLCPACARLLRWLRTRLSEDSELRFNSIYLSSSFADDIRIDSQSMIEFIMDLEQESGVNISDDTVAKVRTVEDVVRHVRLRSAG
jgi:acyl carrier protein